jgi:Threonine dehydrogenase and related Zn-dependent dehydrogenases
MTKMLAGQITGPRRLEMIEMPIPEIENGEFLVQLQVGSICGSDLPYFLFDTSHPALAGSSTPLPPTLSLHELVGFVAQSRSEQFKEGDRVLALPTIPHTGLAEYFVSSDDRAVLLPGGQANHLVLSQPLGTVVHAYRKLPDGLETAVVLGQGPIGQLFTALLRNMGVAKLIAVDLLPERLKFSTRMGATHTVCGNSTEVAAAIEHITEGKFVDLAVEAIGTEETLNLAAKLVKRNGTLLAFGLPHKYNYDFAFHDFFWNEGRLICSLGPTVDDFRVAADMISNGVISVAPLITHTFPFSRAQEAFTLFADRADGVIKVVLTTER